LGTVINQKKFVLNRRFRTAVLVVSPFVSIGLFAILFQIYSGGKGTGLGALDFDLGKLWNWGEENSSVHPPKNLNPPVKLEPFVLNKDPEESKILSPVILPPVVNQQYKGNSELELEQERRKSLLKTSIEYLRPIENKVIYSEEKLIHPYLKRLEYNVLIPSPEKKKRGNFLLKHRCMPTL